MLPIKEITYSEAMLDGVQLPCIAMSEKIQERRQKGNEKTRTTRVSSNGPSNAGYKYSQHALPI